MRWRTYAVVAVLVAGSTTVATADSPRTTCAAGPWTLVGSDTFGLPLALARSQGVTSDGNGWIFSWQGGVSRTDDTYTTLAANTLPPNIAVDHPSYDPATGRNHVGGNHIGDIDVHDGLIYAPVEDGGFNALATTLNNPEHQHPFIALYDAKTLAYTGRSFSLPLELQAAGVPWVAVNPHNGDVYTDEWTMLHDRINVYDKAFRFKEFVDLQYPASFGAGFHLSRVQGAKVIGHTMYASRDDDAKTIYSIDLRSGAVTRLFSLDPSGTAEVEGLAIRSTPDGALLHVLLLRDSRIDASLQARDARVVFEHFAPPADCEA